MAPHLLLTSYITHVDLHHVNSPNDVSEHIVWAYGIFVFVFILFLFVIFYFNSLTALSLMFCVGQVLFILFYIDRHVCIKTDIYLFKRHVPYSHCPTPIHPPIPFISFIPLFLFSSFFSFLLCFPLSHLLTLPYIQHSHSPFPSITYIHTYNHLSLLTLHHRLCTI